MNQQLEKADRKITPQIATKLSAHALRIREALQRSLVEVGHELTEAKALLTHGQFTAWVERETGLTIRTAQMILAAYRLVLKNENFSLLPKSALYLLGAADVSASTLAAIRRRIEAGDVPGVREVKTIVSEAQRSLPNAVNLAVKMDEPLEKATVVDLQVYKVDQTIARAKAEQAAGAAELVQDFRDRIKVADVAVTLNEILDTRQVYQLVTMIRAVPREATLNDLADALERL